MTSPIDLRLLTRPVLLSGLVVALVLLGAAGARGEMAEPFTPVASCPPPVISQPPAVSEPPSLAADTTVACVSTLALGRAVFEHWMNVAASSANGRAVAPVPPLYTSCTESLARAHRRSDPAGRRLLCERRYRLLRGEVMGFLLSSAWVIGESSRLGVGVTEAEALKEFNRIEHRQFPHAREFASFLRRSGQTVADLLFRVRLNLLSERLQKQILNGAHTSRERERALVDFVKEFKDRWQQQTWCRVEYRAQDCGHVVASL